MKKTWQTILTAVIILIGFATPFAKASDVVNYDELIADYEPTPCNVPSFHESISFEQILIDPNSFMKQIDQCKDGDAILAYSRIISLPLSANDCDYLAQCKNNYALNRYSLSECTSTFQEVITLTYTYADYEEMSDNLVFVFTRDGEIIQLIDILVSVDHMRMVTDGGYNNLWLVGETRNGLDQTIRWYNLKSRTFDFSYLVYGINADRIDYHVKVLSLADPVINGMIAENGMLAVRKQVSLLDLTAEKFTVENPEIILYAQIDVYICNNGTGLSLIKTQKYKDATLDSIAGITCEQIMAEEH